MKFNYKYVTAACLSACFLLSSNAYALSQTETQEKPQNSPVVSAESQFTEEYMSSSATVKEVTAIDDRYIVTVTLKDETEQEIALKVSKDTLVIDNKSGICVNVEDIEAGDEVVAYYSMIMTRSLPPQSNCAAIVTNLEDGETQAKYMAAGEIEILEDGGIKAWNADGSYILTIRSGASIISADDGTELTTGDIQEGSRIFSWFDIMLMSYPGQAGTDRVSVAAPASKEAEDTVTEPEAILHVTEFNKIILNGEEVDLTELPIYMIDDIAMIPLRLAAEALGFTVTWNDEDYSIDLDDGEVKAILKIGEDSYYKEKSGEAGSELAISIGAAPELINDRTFVPAALFNLLYSNSDTITVTDGVLTITK